MFLNNLFDSNGNEPKETALVGGLLPSLTYDIRMVAINTIDHSFFTEPVVVKTQEEGNKLKNIICTRFTFSHF